MATSSSESDFWRKIVNNMSGDLPEDGLPPPENENFKKRGRKPRSDGSRKVSVQRIKTIIYVMTDIEGRKYTSSTNQTMALLGEMTLEEALKLANSEES